MPLRGVLRATWLQHQSKREHRRSFHAESSTMDGIVYRTTLLHIRWHACLPADALLYCQSFLHCFCFFRSTAISNQRRSANMSDQSSSDNTSSVTDSSRTARPSRPAHDRNQSYTHVFPASSAVSKTKKTTKRKADAPCLAAPTHVQDENTRLLFGGLQWLLDASVKSQDSHNTRAIRESSEPLSERAITSFNAAKDMNIDKSLKPAKTAAWIDGQRASPAAPPF